MGAVAAILFKSGAAEPVLVERMLAAPRHYTGDCAVRVCGACALGAVNGRDLADSSVSGDGPLVVAFTGRLDNAAELMDALARLGYPPASSSAADIVAAAFRAFRLDAPNRLRGAFAAAVTDGSELWFFRDHFGWRPLVYRDDPARITVASEAKQVIAATALTREPNLDQLQALYYSSLTNDSPTSLKGVDRTAQGHTYGADRSGIIARHRYWQPAELLERSRLRPDEVLEAFAEVFTKVIARSLTGEDVVSLSGGIDSSAVAGFAAPLAREMYGQPLSALSTVYPNHPKVDERAFIQANVDYLGMELHTFTPTAGAWDDLPRWVATFDGPIPTLSLDEIAEFHGKARSLGFRNVLGGELAEITFNLSRHVIGHLVTRGRWKALFELCRTLHAQGYTSAQLARNIALPFVPSRLALWYAHRTGRDFPGRVPDWIDRAKADERPWRRDLTIRGPDRWAFLQVKPYTNNSLSYEASEVTAVLCGTTNRSPFIDIDVIEFFLGLRAEVKFPDLKSKTLVRRMLRGRVPDVILDRRDKTFFNEYTLSHIDYATLRRYLVNPTTRITGVDYDRLAVRLERQDFTIIDYTWVNDLVRIHAFLSQW